MNPTIVKFTANLFAPGAVVPPNMFSWMQKWDNFHSRRILFPIENLFRLTGIQDEARVAKVDFCHIRLTPIDDLYYGALDGVFDQILADTRLDFFLGDQLPRIANTALLKAPPYKLGKTFTSWLELWDCDPEAATGKFIREISMEEIVIKTKTP